ncbi:MAG: hypothetical protein FWF81_09685 [Defluviitaleaceae bacterium]|nr:hypothetical protein [Defluviitaleaceae bacterium]
MIKRKIITISAVLFCASIIANIVFIVNFETARRRHVEHVSNHVNWLYATFSRAANDFNYNYREFRLGDIRGVIFGLHATTNALSTHHNNRAGGGGFFLLEAQSESILRLEEDPTIKLQSIADKFATLHENISPNMPTRELFQMINETAEEISAYLRW